MRTALIFAFRGALLISGASLAYLMFIFGHTDLTSHNRVLQVATLAAVSALVAGILQWVGLPAEGKPPAGTKHGKKKAAK